MIYGMGGYGMHTPSFCDNGGGSEEESGSRGGPSTLLEAINETVLLTHLIGFFPLTIGYSMLGGCIYSANEGRGMLIGAAIPSAIIGSYAACSYISGKIENIRVERAYKKEMKKERRSENHRK